MEIKAWVQMGGERREVSFEVTDAEIAEVGDGGVESYVEEAVVDWISCRYGWGWSCDRMTIDCGFLEDIESPSLVVTDEVLNPRTERRLVRPRAV